jgi:hypothetical protein
MDGIETQVFRDLTYTSALEQNGLVFRLILGTLAPPREGNVAYFYATNGVRPGQRSKNHRR